MSKTKQERNIEAIDTGFIRAEVARQRLTYKDVAEILGITPYELSNKVNERKAFSVCEVVLLADALDCPIDRLYGRA